MLYTVRTVGKRFGNIFLLIAAVAVAAFAIAAGEPAKSAAAHWSFAKPVRSEVPVVRDAGWVRNPIDAFVLARLEKENIRPSPDAPRETLIRRVSLDLTGLPPSPA